MRRRGFLKMSIAGGAVIALGGGYMWLKRGTDTGDLTIEAVLRRLDEFSGRTIVSTGEWSPGQIFTHCAQSVEYSMAGFPEQYSRVFQNTVGRLAFSVFSLRGEMAHGLGEQFPGASTLPRDVATESALVHLKTALTEFGEHSGELAPHFAYGRLSREDYIVAHAMHFYNHLDEITV